MSPAGNMVRQDANYLRKSLQKRPSECHETEADHLRGSLKYFQNALIEAQNEHHEHLKRCEESRDLYHRAKTGMTWATDRYAVQRMLVISLSRQILDMSEPRTGIFPSQGWWAQRFALVVQLSSETEELDKRLDQMETMKEEVRKSKCLYDFNERETKDHRDRAEEMWNDYEELTAEIEDVTSQLIQ